MELKKSEEEFLQERKKIFDTKLIAKNQIKSNVLSWYKILADIAGVVPKNIKITEITQDLSVKDNSNPIIKISGQVNSLEKDALRSISYFVFNLNESLPADSMLKDAVISAVRYDESSKLYDFSVTSDIQKQLTAQLPVKSLNQASNQLPENKTVNKNNLPEKAGKAQEEKAQAENNQDSDKKTIATAIDESVPYENNNNQEVVVNAVSIPVDDDFEVEMPSDSN